jgi:hypothetical protein
VQSSLSRAVAVGKILQQVILSSQVFPIDRHLWL